MGTAQAHRRAGITAVAVAPLLALTGACGNSDEDTEAVTTTTATTASPAASPEPEPDARPAPTDAEVVEAFQTYVDERAAAGVMLAEAVTSITSADGVVTVTMDADPVLLELSPFENHAKLFGTPAAFNDDDGVWLRQTVRRVDVVDAAGQSLGSMTTAELNRKATVG